MPDKRPNEKTITNILEIFDVHNLKKILSIISKEICDKD